MKTLSLVFHVGGPLLAGCIGAYGLTAWPAAREGWLARLLLGGIAAGATTVVLLGFADTARAWAAGGTFGEVLQAGLNGFPGAVALGVMAAAMLGWLPALGSGMLANRIQR